jgi:hypothetical protein
MVNETIMGKWVNVFNETFKNNSNKVFILNMGSSFSRTDD